MKFIPPLEIASKIMTLIEEAEKELIIVSPYVEVSKWNKMKSCLKRAVSRKVNILFIVRQNATQDLSFITDLGIQVSLVENLHAKLYINDNYAVVTSQNITYYSDINSIDIGYRTETKAEKEELIEFVDKYVIAEINIEQITPKSSKFLLVQDSVKPPALNEYKVNKLYESFLAQYPHAYLSKSSVYLYTEGILPYVVMLSSDLTVRLSKKKDDCEKIINHYERIHFPLMEDYRIELKEQTSYYYINFVPIQLKGYSIKKLIKDYSVILNHFNLNLIE